MKPIPKFNKRATLTEAEEVKTWVCSDCGIPIEEGTTCETCRQYWADVDNGLFDGPYHYTDHDLDRLYDDEDFNLFHDPYNHWED